MKIIINAIPNTLTSCNLFCGCVAVYCATLSQFYVAFWLVVAAAVFDFLDGFAARMLKAYSPIGAQLDSLADCVSFGVAPAMVAFSLLVVRYDMSTIYYPYALLGFLLAVFAALRLAKFNIDTRQSEEFRGLPTPAMSLFFVSYAVSYDKLMSSESQLFVYLTIGLIIAFCALMVSDIPMFSFKFKSFGFGTNSLRYFFALFAVLCVVLLGYAAPAVIVLAYVLVSLIRHKSVV